MLSLILMIHFALENSFADQANDWNLRAVGLVYAKRPLMPVGPKIMTIQNHGTAFRVRSQSGEPVWVTASHVARLFSGTDQISTAPAWQKKNGTFEPTEIKYVDGKPTSNFEETDPKHYFSSDSREVLSDAEQQLSEPYIPGNGSQPGSGSDMVMLKNKDGNFSEKEAFDLRSLRSRPLKLDEQISIVGYPFSSQGRGETVPCQFKGFSMVNGGFRGLLYCKTAIPQLTGMSGGPVLDAANRVVGVVSSAVSLRINDALDSSGSNTIVDFTPIVERQGKSLDGLSREEFAQVNCVRQEIKDQRRIVLVNDGLCSVGAAAPIENLNNPPQGNNSSTLQ